MKYPLVDGKVHKALRLDRTKNQWVDLGVLSMACITVPDTCGPEGAAVSFWIKIIDCPDYGGLISSTASGQKKGINIICLNNKIRYYLHIRGVRFVAEHDQNSGWNHITVNFLGPDNGQGIRIYRNGVQDASDDSTYSITVVTGDDITVVGRYYTKQDNYYATLEIDELAFCNAKLSEDQIIELFDMDN